MEDNERKNEMSESNNENASTGNWAYLAGQDWSYLLQYQPRFADKCDWSKLDGYLWTQLLLRQPQFAKHCDWSKLDGGDWARLLTERPEFAEKCDWSKLDAIDWHNLVCQRPEFVEKCDMSKFTGSHIVRLFRERGRRPATGLYARVGECDLSTLTASNWCGILALRPDLADKFEASTRDWSADEPKVSDEDAALDESEVVSADEFFREA